MNLQIRQSIAGAASGTLRKCKHWTLWSEWALECGIHPGQLALADMADYVNEVVSGARQDRSREETSSVSGVIQSLKFVGRKAQVDSLMTVLNPPLVTGYLMGAAVPRPRREALPLPLAALVQLERWICSGSAPDHQISSTWLHPAHGLGRPPLRRRTAHMSLVVASRQIRPTESVLADQSLQIRPAVWSTCIWFFRTSSMLGLGQCVLRCDSQLALPYGEHRRTEPSHRLSSSTPCLPRQALQQQ